MRDGIPTLTGCGIVYSPAFGRTRSPTPVLLQLGAFLRYEGPFPTNPNSQNSSYLVHP